VIHCFFFALFSEAFTNVLRSGHDRRLWLAALLPHQWWRKNIRTGTMTVLFGVIVETKPKKERFFKQNENIFACIRGCCCI